MTLLMQSKNCIKCGKAFNKKATYSKSYWTERKFCSNKCKDSSLKGKKVTHLSNHQFKKGFQPWNKGIKGWCDKFGAGFKKGEKNVMWCGGKSYDRDRKSFEYKQWRMSVFIRDNFTCQFCYQRGVRLEAHHIKPWAKYEELRFDINNGITLCKECHKLTQS
jgi:hypothetical protein